MAPINSVRPRLGFSPVRTKTCCLLQGASVGCSLYIGPPLLSVGRLRIREANAKTIMKHQHLTKLVHPDPNTLRSFIQYRCVIGSRAYGLSHERSDVDRRGFYLPPAELDWSLAGVPSNIRTNGDEVYWEIEKFLRLALNANPTVLECLFSPLIELCTPTAEELIKIRAAFLSTDIHRTYTAYALAQYKRIEHDLQRTGHVRWKHVTHLIRVLLGGVHALTEGTVAVELDKDRDLLMAVARGEISWNKIDAWRLTLHRQLDEALQVTPLPRHPDIECANDFLIRARYIAALPLYGSFDAVRFPPSGGESL